MENPSGSELSMARGAPSMQQDELAMNVSDEEDIPLAMRNTDEYHELMQLKRVSW